MPDFLAFAEGKDELAANGLPATCYFLLSSKSVGATNPFTGNETLAAANLGEITGTGYARKSQAEPVAAGGGLVSFAPMNWLTGAAVDWPNAVRSCVAATGPANVGKALCAWNLQAGGAARDLSLANQVETVTPALQVG